MVHSFVFCQALVLRKIVKEKEMRTANNKAATVIEPIKETEVGELSNDNIRLFRALFEKSKNSFDPLKKFSS